jgi:hypothetical protein
VNPASTFDRLADADGGRRAPMRRASDIPSNPGATAVAFVATGGAND